MSVEGVLFCHHLDAPCPPDTLACITPHHINDTHLLERLEVRQQDIQTLALLAVVTNDDARAADDLTRVALTIDLAQAGPAER